jgi:hypothetical protein
MRAETNMFQKERAGESVIITSDGDQTDFNEEEK